MPFKPLPDPVALTTWLSPDTLAEIVKAAQKRGITAERALSLVINGIVVDESFERLLKREPYFEGFRFRRRLFNVSEANLLVRDRAPNYVYNLDEAARKKLATVQIDYAYSMHADLSRPILLVPDQREGVISIDGHHRIYKGLVLGRDFLPAHLLSKDEARRIRIK